MIKQRIDELRQMLASFGGAAAKSVIQEIRQLLAELGQLAAALNTGSSSGGAAPSSGAAAPATADGGGANSPATPSASVQGAADVDEDAAGLDTGHLDEGRAAYAEQQRAADAARVVDATAANDSASPPESDPDWKARPLTGIVNASQAKHPQNEVALELKSLREKLLALKKQAENVLAHEDSQQARHTPASVSKVTD